jgi:hypothetical protein
MQVMNFFCNTWLPLLPHKKKNQKTESIFIVYFMYTRCSFKTMNFKKIIHRLKVCSAGIGVAPQPVIGKREVPSEIFDLGMEDDDGRIIACESCCNTTTCNNGGACGVAGKYAKP